jgi:hypothetical protein
MGDMIRINTVIGNPEGKRPLGRARRRWEDIRTELREIQSEVVDLIHLAHDRNQWWILVNTEMNLQIP